MAQPRKQERVHADREGDSQCWPPQQSGQTWPTAETLGPPLLERIVPCRPLMTGNPRALSQKAHLFPFFPVSQPSFYISCAAFSCCLFKNRRAFLRWERCRVHH